MKPILFKSDMVRAILDGRKTQTRRVIKPQPVTDDEKYQDPPEIISDGTLYYSRLYLNIKCPYGKVGDTLWVRENWWHERGIGFENAAFDDGYFVQGDGKIKQYIPDWHPTKAVWRKRPSIYMPKWACRIFLEITGIRVEKVQDIDAIGAANEGIYFPENQFHTPLEYVMKFSELWDSINAKPKPAKKNPYTNAPELCKVAYPWADVREETIITQKASKFYNCKVYIVGNPYVWAEEFKRKDK